MATKKINQYIDHTNINPKAKKEDIIKTCKEAIQYQFRGVCIRPQWVKTAAQILKGSGVKVVVLIDDPIGDSDSKKRLAIAKKAVADGADELDVVANIPDIKHERWNKIEKDLQAICKLQNTKVIIGSGYLTDEEIAQVSQIVKKAGAICVKTATEKDPLENRELEEKAKHLKIMRQNAPGLLIKASGKIKTLADAEMMIKAGADIVGTSNGVTIMKQLKR
ncbi:MAG TPA: deoxyribose-phosphate aldolase [Candidatus Pacearchaeota archaeon]|jgi:deoxyribose-phosphate aldolase|nr:deoxyribose-phosphate aldolase [Candidatus Pacearchaeota archaeon]HRR94711.1 deoxyribose-phosphate aldolase [Candidatus Paceibacterota bacterium]HPC30489.1 deoxyribose-phosphate aldolase [Candidatus Pacearchaeota archaeon]HQG09226.1 deoxyribose-phosphate aldolase [Candidatus Pacearchaeota archaeon]HQH20160.1 deoxyribose-phosphate aldolase [Candidatus Pacearchaeota archaeon]